MVERAHHRRRWIGDVATVAGLVVITLAGYVGFAEEPVSPVARTAAVGAAVAGGGLVVTGYRATVSHARSSVARSRDEES